MMSREPLLLDVDGLLIVTAATSAEEGAVLDEQGVVAETGVV